MDSFQRILTFLRLAPPPPPPPTFLFFCDRLPWHPRMDPKRHTALFSTSLSKLHVESPVASRLRRNPAAFVPPISPFASSFLSWQGFFRPVYNGPTLTPVDRDLSREKPSFFAQREPCPFDPHAVDRSFLYGAFSRSRRPDYPTQVPAALWHLSRFQR